MKKQTPFRIDLEECHNENCYKCSNTKERDNHIYNDLCKTALSKLDNLPIRCIGDWGYEKIYRLVQYFGIFSKGMHKKWDALNYIEICSGPGRCVTRNNGKELNGTALAILKHSSFRDYLTQALFIDYNNQAVDVLNERIKQEGLECKAKAVCIDFNDLEAVEEALSTLNNRSLNLVLADPTECNLPFKTICKISSELNNVDFIINNALGTDIKRNIKNAILDNGFIKVKQKYSAFIGDNELLESDKVKKMAENSDIEGLTTALMDRYKDNWKSIGYKYFDEKPVRHYYKIMFISKHQLGLNFWDKANKYEPNGQMTFEGF